MMLKAKYLIPKKVKFNIKKRINKKEKYFSLGKFQY